jgi:adenylosuccinate lyase
MLKKACWLVDKLNVYPEIMAANMEKSFGLLYSQRVLLALVETGMLRDDAYAVVQRSAMKAWQEKTPFLELLKADPEVTARLTASQLESCFNPGSQLQNMGVIFDRIGALDW